MDAFGKPLDPAILVEPPRQEKKPLPFAALVAIALPIAALAGAVLLQRNLEGPILAGDAMGRWMVMALLLGLPLGLLAGLFLARGIRRALWIAWGALSPLLVAAAVLAGVRAAHPIRELISDRQVRNCLETRRVCSAGEFRALCGEAGKGANAKQSMEAKLGFAQQSLCDANGCTYRWLYAGPWTPDNWVAPGSLLCSVVIDPRGISQRSTLGPGVEVP